MNSSTERRSVSLAQLSLFALIIGTATGIAAVLFRALVAGIHNAFFLGTLSFYYDPNLHTPPSWLGPLVILSPVIGGMIVVFLSRAMPIERRGQGVSDIIDAIYYREGKVRTVSAMAKSLAAGVASGSGASVGREAAIVQIGAALASRIARLARLAQWQRVTLVAAGAAAGLAAAFNTPLGAIAFVLELMMPEISARTLLPVTIAAGAGTFVARFFYGLQPTFLVQTATATALRLEGIAGLGLFLIFGLLLGLVAWLMIWLLGWTEQQFDRLSPNPYLRHAIGMSLVGVLAYGLMSFTGYYYIEGASYPIIQDILGNRIHLFGFFLLLFLVKMTATTISLGSGGSGGVFSASLVIGATLGGAFGAVATTLFPAFGLSITDFSIAGMAGVLGGTTGAAITAIVMVFELTRDYNVIVPVILCVTLAIAVRRAIQPQSVYTLKLARKGHEVPDGLQANMYMVRQARKTMSRDFVVLSAGTSVEDAVTALKPSDRPVYALVAAGERLKGYVRFDPDAKRWRPRDGGMTLGALAQSDYVLARPEAAMFDVIGRLARRASALVIVSGGTRRIPRIGDIQGVISVEMMGATVVENVRPFLARPVPNPLPSLYRKHIGRWLSAWRRRPRSRWRLYTAGSLIRGRLFRFRRLGAARRQ